MSLQTFNETLTSMIADGSQILNTTTETIMVPDFTVAANYMYPGRTLRAQIDFDVSNVVTTPGTLTLRARWGGVAGTVLATSGAIALDTTARSNFSGHLELKLVCRTSGSSGSIYTMGFAIITDVPVESAGVIHPFMIPGSAPAVVGSLDTTTAKALSFTAQFSVSTATTQLTSHLYTLESLT